MKNGRQRMGRNGATSGRGSTKSPQLPGRSVEKAKAGVQGGASGAYTTTRRTGVSSKSRKGSTP